MTRFRSRPSPQHDLLAAPRSARTWPAWPWSRRQARAEVATAPRGRLKTGGKGLLALLVLAVAAGCATRPDPVLAPMGQASFADYQRDTTHWMQQHRHFQSDTPAAELTWNAPAQWQPAGPTQRGIVLFHGLGDSPWSLTDIGRQLAEQGFLVRTALLPGHGTRPEHLLGVRLQDWQQVVREQVALMRQDVPQVYLGGFSTGANLALAYALEHEDEIQGLALFSPALQSNVAYDWVVPWVAPFKPWLREPDGSRPQQSPLRYLNVPTNGFVQFYRSSVLVRDRLAQKPYPHPALLVLAQHDSVVDVTAVRHTFQTRFTHPDSRLIWYGDIPSEAAANPRILARPDHLPEERISQFSHMGILFAPDNPLYGRTGTQRLCHNGQSPEAQTRCLAGEPVWYSDWGYQEPDKDHARLTFNPYFAWQASVMRDVLNATP